MIRRPPAVRSSRPQRARTARAITLPAALPALLRFVPLTVLLAALLVALPLALPAGRDAPGRPTVAEARASDGYAQAEVAIHGTTIRVDVADTPDKQSLGLGGRTALGPREGMLFVYADKARHSFWMYRMRIPIDMIWLDNRRVVYIAADVPPPAAGQTTAELPTYQPDEPANFVLELAAGRARELGLRVGDSVHFRFDLR